MKTILIQKLKLRWPWAKYECYECPGAWYLRWPWALVRYNPGSSEPMIRWIAPPLMNMSERSADLLKYVGGVEQFKFTNTTIEWVEDDVWNNHEDSA